MTDIDLKYVGSLAEKALRRTIIDADDGSLRRFIINDKEGRYELLPIADRYPREPRVVADIVSLADLVVAEGVRMDTTGLYMTASFDRNGGTVHLEENLGRHGSHINFVRMPSFALENLNSALTGWRKHADFLVILANLSPWMAPGTSKAILAAFRKIEVSANSAITSQPHLDDTGAKGDSWKFEMRVGSGTAGTVDLPTAIQLTMPFALRSAATYDVEAQIDVTAERDEKAQTYRPLFRLIAPTLAAVREKALEDELAFFGDVVKKSVPDIVIVRHG